ncbi:MAG: serine/threonine-protein kinase [bacterium]
MSAITIGSTFLDRYRIDHVLGRGAYAKVFRAHQLDLGRDVALKVLSPMTNRPDKMAEARLRFEREAKLVARLQDPHTIHLFDWGHSPDGDMYMATELVDGQTLHDVWVDGDPMPWQRAVHIVVQVLYSLQEAHSLGVLHRDIKPSNIMLFDRPGRPDQVKVLDFGIAKAFETPEDTANEDSMKMALTARGRVVGTPGYMAPEQLRGEPLTPGTDLYSVGIIALELLTSEPAFKSRNDFETAALQLDAAPLVIPDDIDVPQPVRDTLNALLIKRTEDRLSSAADAIEALSAALGNAPAAKPAEVLVLSDEVKPGPNPILMAAVGFVLIAILVAIVAFIAR